MKQKSAPRLPKIKSLKAQKLMLLTVCFDQYALDYFLKIVKPYQAVQSFLTKKVP